MANPKIPCNAQVLSKSTWATLYSIIGDYYTNQLTNQNAPLPPWAQPDPIPWPHPPSGYFYGPAIGFGNAGGLNYQDGYGLVIDAFTGAIDWLPSNGTITNDFAFQLEILGAGPKFYWPLDDVPGSTAAREVMQGHYAIGFGQYSFGATDPWNNPQALRLTGQDSYFMQAGVTPRSGAFSLLAAYQSTAVTGGMIEFASAAYDGESPQWTPSMMYDAADGQLIGYSFGGPINEFVLDQGGATNNNQWHLGIFTYDGAETLTLWRDGSLVGENGGAGTQAFNGFWKIGFCDYYPSSPYFNGALSNVAVFDYQLSPTQVGNIWNGWQLGG